MSLHEHQMVPDHDIPPYAWHYKCAVEGCDYETDSFKIPSGESQFTQAVAEWANAEIARLRAKVDRDKSQMQVLLRCIEDNDEEIEQLKRERDEALAQIALFIKECSCQDWTSERLFSMLIDKARALLDRLQRAEAAVEAAKNAVEWWGYGSREKLRAALATLEKEKS